MKKYCVSVIIIISLLLSMISAFASEIQIIRDIENETFTISGTAEPESVVRALVTAPGKEYSDAADALNSFDVVKYQMETEASAEGEYAFEVELSSVSGVYTAYIAADNLISELELEYINPENYANTVDGLNEADDIESYIEENRDDLGFFLKLYDGVDKTEVCNKLEKALSLNENNIEECVAVFNSAVIATAIEENEIDGISDYADKIYILNNGSVADNWYKKADADKVDERIDGKFDTVEAFESAIYEAIVLSIIEKPGGYLNVKNVIGDFKNEIGISSPTAKDDVYKKLAGKSYDSYTDLKKAYNELLKGDSGSSGGGGGGGGSSSKGDKNDVIFPGISSEQIPVPEAEKPIVKKYFSDMQSAVWAEEACEYLAEKGILTGKSEGVFAPLESITREEFVTIIVRAFNIEKYVDNTVFADISVNDWCYDFVLAANQNNIIGGIGDGLFGKGQNITRQDMATILYRVINMKGVQIGAVGENVSFKDENSISDYAKEAVEYLSSRGIINGMGNGTFSGRENASRAQAAQMIYKVLESMEG